MREGLIDDGDAGLGLKLTAQSGTDLIRVVSHQKFEVHGMIVPRLGPLRYQTWLICVYEIDYTGVGFRLHRNFRWSEIG